MTLQASIKALRDDAALWRGVAYATGSAGRTAAGLTLGEQQLSFVSTYTGLLSQYSAIQFMMKQLLEEGTTVTKGLSETLDQVAYQYTMSDENASKRFDNQWEPRR